MYIFIFIYREIDIYITLWAAGRAVLREKLRKHRILRWQSKIEMKEGCFLLPL